MAILLAGLVQFQIIITLGQGSTLERIVRLPRVQATRREETGHKMRKHGRKAHDIDQLHGRLRRGGHQKVINKFGNRGVVSHFDQLRNSEDLEDLEDAADF